METRDASGACLGSLSPLKLRGVKSDRSEPQVLITLNARRAGRPMRSIGQGCGDLVHNPIASVSGSGRSCR